MNKKKILLLTGYYLLVAFSMIIFTFNIRQLVQNFRVLFFLIIGFIMLYVSIQQHWYVVMVVLSVLLFLFLVLTPMCS